jgi:hypothetical protein
MRVHNLGPHTFISEQPHSRNHEWLTSFTPAQRRQLIDEDIHARTEIAIVMASAMAFGMVISTIAFLFAL